MWKFGILIKIKHYNATLRKLRFWKSRNLLDHPLYIVRAAVTIYLLSTFSYVNGLNFNSTHTSHTLTKSTNLSTNVCQLPEPPCLKWIKVEYTSPEEALGRSFFLLFDTDQNIWIKPKWHSRLSPCIDKSWFKWIKSLVIQCKK